MIALATIIIMVHAVVPHHHHDCCEVAGFVFETELMCCCNENECPKCSTADCHEHHHHSQHPFDNCKLQDLLSKLVLNSDDKKFLSASLQAPLITLYSLDFQQIKIKVPEVEFFASNLDFWNENLPPEPQIYSHSLRAPPSVLSVL